MYAICEEDNGSNKEVDKPKKTVPQNLALVTIMVVETISLVRLRTLLKVILDSESTTTSINEICLPRHCKQYKVSSSRKVSTLAGTYTSTEIVIMHNLRLPEFDKTDMLSNRRHSYFSQRLASTMPFWVLIFLTK